jgi:hypothetical protein
MTAVTTIDHATLEHLSQAGAVRGACVVGQPGGWGVVIQYGTTERTLTAKRGAVRIFRKFETLARYLKTVGIEEFKTDTRQFDPTTTRPTAQRADAAERMRQTHAAAAYDKWFRAEVADGIQEADDASTQWVSNEEAKTSWAKQRAELVKRAGGTP